MTIHMICLLVLLAAGATEAAINEPAPTPCPRDLSQKLQNPITFANGSIASHNLIFPNGTYWKSNDTYFGCPCEVTRCLKTLCPSDDDMNNEAEASEPFNLTVWHEGRPLLVNSHSHFFPLSKGCPNGRIMITLEPEEFKADAHHFLHNGSLVFNDSGMVHGPEDFCLNGSEIGFTTYFCLPDESTDGETTSSTKVHKIYPWFLLISVFFLALTLLAYALTPDMLRNVHGRCQFAHAASFLFGFLFLAIIQLIGDTVGNAGCYTLAFVTYFSLLAAFFWLNVMCFDIWWTFSGVINMASSLHSSPGKKFMRYSCYAWGAPLILFAVTMSMHLSSSVPEDFKPGFGIQTCWFQNDFVTFIYFNVFVSVLLLLNIFFFVWTTVKILRLKRETAMLGRNSSRRISADNAQDEQRLVLYLKLFLVMGLSWVMEIVSWLVGGPEEYWYFTDIINTLQGVFIFVFCVWCTRVRDSLLKKLCPPSVARRVSTKCSGVVPSSSESRSTHSSGNNPAAGASPNSMPLTTLSEGTIADSADKFGDVGVLPSVSKRVPDGPGASTAPPATVLHM